MASFKRYRTIWLLFLTYGISYGQKVDLYNWPHMAIDECLTVHFIHTDSIYDSKQRMTILQLYKATHAGYEVDLAYSDSALIRTSDFARNNLAVAAINGSFFDMKNGGSVTYLESDGKMIDSTRSKNKLTINGAIVIGLNDSIHIEPSRGDHFYETSLKEEDVIVSGPLLIYHGVPENLPDVPFVVLRHPRTCLCETRETLLFATIDGRREEAQGMSLFELQKFLISLGCIHAINLDGGGSTTMWGLMNGNGQILNQPSDPSGERPVANALVIKKKIIKD